LTQPISGASPSARADSCAVSAVARLTWRVKAVAGSEKA
jgi:hypothetical protein